VNLTVWPQSNKCTSASLSLTSDVPHNFEFWSWVIILWQWWQMYTIATFSRTHSPSWSAATWRHSAFIRWSRWTLTMAVMMAVPQTMMMTMTFIVTTQCLKKVHPFYFCDYSVKCWSILIMFGGIAAEKICKQRAGSRTEENNFYQYHHCKYCLKCDIRIFTFWNWEKNGCHFTM